MIAHLSSPFFSSGRRNCECASRGVQAALGLPTLSVRSMDEKLQIAEKIDHVIHMMLTAINKVKQAAGSFVKLPKAELDLLAQIEIARDVIMEVLKNQYDRTLLHDIFGGDCARIVRIRAMCEGITFSQMNQGDQRLPTCLRACESVEKVLIDLGEGEALRKAQSSIAESDDVAEWSPPARLPQTANQESDLSFRRRISNESDGTPKSSSNNIIKIVEADAERRESRLREDFAELQAATEHRESQLRQSLASMESHLSAQMEGFKKSLDGSITSVQARLKKVEAQVGELLAEAQLVDLVAELGTVRVEVEQKSSILTRRLEKLETRANDIGSEATATSQQVEKLDVRATDIESRALRTTQAVEKLEALAVDLQNRASMSEQQAGHLSEQLSQSLADVKKRCSEQLDQRLGDVKKRCASITEAHIQDFEALDKATSGLESRLSGVERQLVTLSETDQQQQKVFDGTRKEFLERADQNDDTIKQLQQSITKSYTEEIEKLRRESNLDPLWQSFAHVGSLVRNLQKRIDDIDTMKERDMWETPRKKTFSMHRSQSAGATERSPPSRCDPFMDNSHRGSPAHLVGLTAGCPF